MTAVAAQVIVLHCDQGMGTLVRIWENVDGANEITHMVLVDLGCSTKRKRRAGDAVDNVIISLQQMAAPKIDLLMISHQDDDHWSLLPDLIEALIEDGIACTLGAFYRGGVNWKAAAKDAIEMVEQHFGTKCIPWTDTRSDYGNPAGGKTAVTTIEGVAIRILVVNADSTKSVENGTSIVTVVDFGGSNSIIPGDATSQTLAACTTYIDEWIAANKVNPIRPCYLLTAPHHGALYTIADNFTTRNPQLNLATEFARRVDAGWLAASAGYMTRLRHPYKNVMQLLGYQVGSIALLHDYVWWDQAVPKWEQITATNQNFYTTVTSLTDPPVVKAWSFVMFPSGAVTFRPMDHTDVQPPGRDPGVSGPDPRWLAELEAARRRKTSVAARPRAGSVHA